MTCANCGTRNLDGAKYCRGCGARLGDATAPRAPSVNLPDQNPRLSIVESLIAEQRALSNALPPDASPEDINPATSSLDEQLSADSDAAAAEQRTLMRERLRLLTEQNDDADAIQNKEQLRERLRVLTLQNKGADATLQNQLSNEQEQEEVATEQRRLMRERLHLLTKQNQSDGASAS